MRGATVAILYADGVEKISIHAPRAGGDTNATGGSFKLLNISIHAPRAGGDVWRPAQPVIGKEISIHAPRAGGDGWRDANKELPKISIHAPRAGGDLSLLQSGLLSYHFNPRPPCGGRLLPDEKSEPPRIFQSTPPVRGATPLLSPFAGGDAFQSTPPVRGATSGLRQISRSLRYFNPRPPCGGRP